jgi:macrolide-specific efflux system membrane fusion protein
MVAALWGRSRLLVRGTLLFASAILLVGGVAYTRNRIQRSRETESIRLSVVRPERRRMAASVLATGTIRLKVGAQVRVGSQLSGVVKRLKVSVGAQVQKGDVIAEIDTRSVWARIAQARSQVGENEVDLAKARRDLDRGSRLLAEGLLAGQQGEDLEWAVEAASAKLEKARADLAAAQVDLAYATIRAPIAGTVSSVSTQEGETVAASFTAPTFVTIVEARALELVAMVDEVDIAGVRPGNSASFTVEAYPSVDFSGVVERVNPTATIVSGVVNYEVVITLRDQAGLLKPDMTANVSVRTGEREALVLPDAAIHGEGEGKFVYVVENAQTRRRDVTTGAHEASFTEIKRGLTGQEQVLVGAAAVPKTEASP